MSIKVDRVAAFWDAVRALSYREMTTVAFEVNQFLPDGEQISDQMVAEALDNAAEGKPTGPATRGG